MNIDDLVNFRSKQYTGLIPLSFSLHSFPHRDLMQFGFLCNRLHDSSFLLASRLYMGDKIPQMHYIVNDERYTVNDIHRSDTVERLSIHIVPDIEVFPKNVVEIFHGQWLDCGEVIDTTDGITLKNGHTTLSIPERNIKGYIVYQ